MGTVIEMPVSATLAWARKIYREVDPLDTGATDIAAIHLMRTRPPVRSCPVAPRSRILLCGTGVDHEPLKGLVPQIAPRYGLHEYDLTFVREIGLTFWMRFFNTPDFVADYQLRHLPSLIITTGVMRCYAFGAGDNVGCECVLGDIAREWDIPLEIVALGK